MEGKSSQNIHTYPTPLWTNSVILFVAATTIFIVWYVQYLCGRRKLYLHSFKVPGPFSLPFVGSAMHFVRDPHDIFRNITKLLNSYPGICKFWLGPKCIFAITEPKYIEILVTNCLKKELHYKYTEIFMGHGLFSAPVVKKWKKHRKLISPTFNQKILDGFVEIFTEQADILLEQLKKYSGKGEFDLFHVFSKYTLDTICETAMGVTVKAQTTNSLFSKWLEKGMEITFLRMFVIWYHFDAIFNMTSLSKILKDCTENGRRFTSEVVRNKKESLKLLKLQEPEENTGVRGRHRKVFLDYLIESNFTDQELRDEVNTFISAGSETTATTLCFALIILGLYPDLQQKVYEEIMNILGPERKPEPSDLPNMKYLDLFIKETLRFFPVAAIIGRYVETEINIGDYIIPEGSTIIFGIFQLHRDEKYWPDPLKFIPERFLPEEVAKRHPCAYIPFSYGPRNCIGQKYALMALKTILSTVVRRYEVFTSYKSIEEIELTCKLVLKPKDGYKVSLELRRNT